MIERDLLAVEVKEEPPKVEEEEGVSKDKIIAIKVIDIDGKQFLCHKVLINDTLTGLSLKYNISVNVLKKCNQLMGDSIFQKEELLVPVQPGMQIKIAAGPTEEQKAKREEDRRQTALMMLN